MFHRIEVEPIRTAPKEGECEFRLDNELYFLTPQEYRIEMAKTAKENGADEKDNFFITVEASAYRLPQHTRIFIGGYMHST